MVYSSTCEYIHTIDTYMKYTAMQGGLDLTNKRFTNHSVRKTTVCKLQKAGVSNDKIAAVTGHRNEQSLRSYSNADLEDHHQGISKILSSCNSNSSYSSSRNNQSGNNSVQANSSIPFASSVSLLKLLAFLHHQQRLQDHHLIISPIKNIG